MAVATAATVAAAAAPCQDNRGVDRQDTEAVVGEPEALQASEGCLEGGVESKTQPARGKKTLHVRTR
jgi:hypothetical protein